MKSRIPVAGPWITSREIEYVTDAVTNAWFADANVYNFRFEKAFADRHGMRHAMSLPSCTSGIHLALAATGVGHGDEVIVPETTWIATAAPISYVGASPVFVDVDESTWCMSSAAFEAAITPRTRAVITVDLYGNMPDYDSILAIAEKHGITVIEDAAEAVGATYKGRLAGTFGKAGVFSFHGSKTLTTCEGGMLLTNDSTLNNRANFLRDHGRVPGDFSFENKEVAFKYKMTSMQAALGLAQLERLDDLVSRKRQIFAWYAQRLAGLSDVVINTPGPDVDAVYWMVSAVWDNEAYRLDKRNLRDILQAENIDTRPFFSPLSSLEAYSKLPGARNAKDVNKVSYKLGECGINLPSHLLLTEDDVDRVCQIVSRAFGQARR